VQRVAHRAPDRLHARSLRIVQAPADTTKPHYPVDKQCGFMRARHHTMRMRGRKLIHFLRVSLHLRADRKRLRSGGPNHNNIARSMNRTDNECLFRSRVWRRVLRKYRPALGILSRNAFDLRVWNEEYRGEFLKRAPWLSWMPTMTFATLGGMSRTRSPLSTEPANGYAVPLYVRMPGQTKRYVCMTLRQ